MSKISIVVPMYNVEKYIEQCLDSCLNQTLEDIEIIVIDDESKDSSLIKAKEYEKKDKRITVLEQKNSGVSVARNRGIEKAKSKWVMFVDGDDWLSLDCCEKLYKVAESENCSIVIGGFVEEGNNYSKNDRFLNIKEATFEKKNIELIKNCIFKTNLYQPNSVTNIGVPWAKLYLKSYLERNDLKFKVGLKRMQDMIFNLEALYLADRIIYKDFPVYHYRCQNDSVTNKFSNDFDSTAKKILMYMNEFMKKYNVEEELADYYKIKSFLLFDEIIKLKYVPNKNRNNIFNKIKSLHILKKDSYFKENCSIKLNKYFNLKLKIKNTFYSINVLFPLYVINLYKLNKRNKKNY